MWKDIYCLEGEASELTMQLHRCVSRSFLLVFLLDHVLVSETVEEVWHMVGTYEMSQYRVDTFLGLQMLGKHGACCCLGWTERALGSHSLYRVQSDRS